AWDEKSDLGNGRRALVEAPLSVAGTLATNLYDERTVVATSATLTLGGRFDSVARSLGLPAPAPVPAARSGAGLSADAPPVSGDGWSSLDVGSPFDYPRQGILYVAAHLPRPAASGLPDPAGEELLKLVEALGGRTLGLFSSRRAATQAAELLRARTDLPVLLQGEESLPILVRKFREQKESCLFGVMSLWQGVDVPGDACQLVVIDRLPFPRPDEPLAAARAAAVDATGGSGFASVSVPIAAVRLAQGVGRLIRSTGDKGVVAVLDSRLETARGYGAFLRKSLPPFWYTTRPEVAVGALQRLAKS
ncbi:ATP-dependent DNA helicase, partial [Actinoplanes sp. NPDC048791]|uniref:ATP-dependent DNA helicase n=1 Tax=Actinoplanes sp. NPDC048791 TaxID=3154623 RepID=UPI0033CB4067